MNDYLENLLELFDESKDPSEKIKDELNEKFKNLPEETKESVIGKILDKKDILDPSYLKLITFLTDGRSEEDLSSYIDTLPGELPELAAFLFDNNEKWEEKPWARKVLALLAILYSGLDLSDLQDFFENALGDLDKDEIAETFGDLVEVSRTGIISVADMDLKEVLCSGLNPEEIEDTTEKLISWLKKKDDFYPVKLKELYYQAFLTGDEALALDYLNRLLEKDADNENFPLLTDAIAYTIYDSGGSKFYKALLTASEADHKIYRYTNRLPLGIRMVLEDYMSIIKDVLEENDRQTKEYIKREKITNPLKSELLLYNSNRLGEVDTLGLYLDHETSKRQNFEKALGHLQKLTDTSGDLAINAIYTAYTDRLARECVFYSLNPETALDEFKSLFETQKTLVREDPTQDNIYDLTEIQSTIAFLYLCNDDYIQAFAYFQDAFSTKMHLIDTFLDLQAAEDLRALYAVLAELYRIAGKTEEAIENYEYAVQLHLTAQEEKIEENKYHRLELVNDLFNLACLYQEVGQTDKARHYFEETLEWADKLEDKTMLRFGDERYSYVYNWLGIHYAKRNDFSKATYYFRKNVETSERMYEEDEKTALYRLARDCENLGKLYLQTEDFDKAFHYYRRALNLYEKHVKLPADREILEEAVSTAELLSLLGSKLDDFDNNRDFAERSIRMRSALVDAFPERDTILDLMRIKNKTGDAYRKMRDREKALQYYSEANELAEEIKGLKDDKEALEVLAHGLYYNGFVHIQQKENQEAYEVLLKDLEIEKYLFEKYGDNKRDLGRAYTTIGDTFIFQKKSAEALDYYLKALELREELALEEESAEVLKDLCQTYYATASAYISEGDFDQAKVYHQLNLETCIKLIGEYKDLSLFKVARSSLASLKSMGILARDFEEALKYELLSVELDQLMKNLVDDDDE